MYISNILNKTKGHSNFKFVDIDINSDNELFIDPRLIEIGKDEFCVQARKKINSFFDRLYLLYKTNTTDTEKLKLFSHFHEINATKLGYGNGDNGKAKTAEGMLKTLKDLEKVINSGIKCSDPTDIPVFVHNFAEDRMSDMLTNILFKELNDFTVEVFKSYGWLPKKPNKDVYYWDSLKNTWKKNKESCIEINGEIILLVPKNIVRKRFIFNAEHYFRHVIARRLQADSITYDMNGKEYKTGIGEIMEKSKIDHGDYINADIYETLKHPEDLNQYHKINVAMYVSHGSLSDIELDKIVYAGH